MYTILNLSILVLVFRTIYRFLSGKLYEEDFMKKEPAVYILANRQRGVLYVGVTSNLIQRVWQHKHKIYKGFTAKYNVDQLVYYEFYASMIDAIRREKQLKHGSRVSKIELIERMNSEWRDLYFILTSLE
jgi:putative endonuclease